MKAVVLEETRKTVIREIPDAQMRETTDLLLRLTSTAICGTDLHSYEGRMRGPEGQVIGHEPLRVVEEVGSAVKTSKRETAPSSPPTSAAVFAQCARMAIRQLVLQRMPDRRGQPTVIPTRVVIRERRRSCSEFHSPIRIV